MKFKNLGWLPEALPLWEISINYEMVSSEKLWKSSFKILKIKSAKTLDWPNVGRDPALVWGTQTVRLTGAFLLFILKILPRSKTHTLSFRNKLWNCCSEFLKKQSFMTGWRSGWGSVLSVLIWRPKMPRSCTVQHPLHSVGSTTWKENTKCKVKFHFIHSWLSTSCSHREGGGLWLDGTMWLLLKI